MDAQNITLTATKNVAPITATKMIKEELQQKLDKELLHWRKIKKKEHTANDFRERHFTCYKAYYHLHKKNTLKIPPANLSSLMKMLHRNE